MLKKTFWIRFLSSFILILLGLYLIAAIGNKQAISEPAEKEQLTNETKNVSKDKVIKVKTQGLARYIGVSSLVFAERFGAPTLEFASAENIKWQQYATADEMLVGIDQYTDKVCVIYLLSKQTTPDELNIGMTRKNFERTFKLSERFKIRSNEQTTQISLSETDLLEKPLLAFKNGSYVVSYFSKKDHKIVALEYLAKEELLRSSLYHVSSQTPLPVRYSTTVSKQENYKQVLSSVWQLIGHMRQTQSMTQLDYDQEATEMAKNIAKTLAKDPKKYLSKTQLEQYKLLKADRLNDVSGLKLTSKQISKKLLTDAGVDKKRYAVYLGGPVTVPAQLVATTGKDQIFWNKFIYHDSEMAGFEYSNSILIGVYKKDN